MRLFGRKKWRDVTFESAKQRKTRVSASAKVAKTQARTRLKAQKVSARKTKKILKRVWRRII